MDRWQLYEYLKGSVVSAINTAAVEKMDPDELREGTIEYLEMIKKNGR